MKKNETECITRTELTKRWSKRLVELFDIEPTRRYRNTHHGFTYLYDIKVIERFEKTKKFQREWEKTAKCKATYKANEATYKAAQEKVADQRWQKKWEELDDTIDYVESILAEELDDWDANDLINKALDYYNDRQLTFNINHCWRHRRDCDDEFLIEKAQAFVRHRVVGYDDYYNERGKKFMHDELQSYINNRVEKHIRSQWAESKAKKTA